MLRRDAKADLVWEALADATRRRLVELLAGGPRTTGGLVKEVPGFSRTSVMKHLAVLVAAGIVKVRRQGRERWNQLDPAPIRKTCPPWIERHLRQLDQAMQRLKATAESMAADGAKASSRGKRTTRPGNHA